MIADKADDTDVILALVAEAGGVAVIPSRANRKVPQELDWELHAAAARSSASSANSKRY